MTVTGNADRQRSGKMSKNIENAILLDTYGSMLTEKQYDTLSLYYDEDLSLSEIAENMGSQDRVFTSVSEPLRSILHSLKKPSALRKNTAGSVIYAMN